MELVIEMDRKTYNRTVEAVEAVEKMLDEANLEYNESYILIVQIKKVGVTIS